MRGHATPVPLILMTRVARTSPAASAAESLAVSRPLNSGAGSKPTIIVQLCPASSTFTVNDSWQVEPGWPGEKSSGDWSATVTYSVCELRFVIVTILVVKVLKAWVPNLSECGLVLRSAWAPAGGGTARTAADTSETANSRIHRDRASAPDKNLTSKRGHWLSFSIAGAENLSTTRSRGRCGRTRFRQPDVDRCVRNLALVLLIVGLSAACAGGGSSAPVSAGSHHRTPTSALVRAFGDQVGLSARFPSAWYAQAYGATTLLITSFPIHVDDGRVWDAIPAGGTVIQIYDEPPGSIRACRRLRGAHGRVRLGRFEPNYEGFGAAYRSQFHDHAHRVLVFTGFGGRPPTTDQRRLADRVLKSINVEPGACPVKTTIALGTRAAGTNVLAVGVP